MVGEEVTFQSHAGSIEAVDRISQVAREELFQSHAGSIEAGRSLGGILVNAFVSIPRWFD